MMKSYSLPCFNSIKVRLKHYDYKTNYDIVLFQFHKGPIKAKTISGSTSLVYSFNSIKVRLKQRAHTLSLPLAVVSIP